MLAKKHIYFPKESDLKKNYFALIAILSVVITFTAVISYTFSQNNNSDSDKADINIVTSFYPMYIIALNLTDNVDNLSVTNLAPNQTGCLHDYQFSTSDMKKLDGADAFIINGGGMETFITDVVNQYKDIDIIDSSVGIAFLEENGEHEHHEDNHNEDIHDDGHNEDQDESHEHEHDEDEDEGHEHEHEHGDYNAHAWMDPDRYIMQINNVRDGLINLDPDNEALYRKNASNYVKKVADISSRLDNIDMNGEDNVIIFHDAFAYLASRIGLSVAASIEIESDNTALSSGEIASIIDEMNEHNIKSIFIEKQFDTGIARTIADATDAKIYVIDSIVTGNDDKDAYIDAMNNNIDVIIPLQ